MRTAVLLVIMAVTIGWTAAPAEASRPGALADTVSPPATSPMASAPAAVVPTGEVAWTRLGRIPGGRGNHGGGPFQVAGFHRGYVVVNGSRNVRFSTDGVSWSSIRLTHPGGVPLGIHVAAGNPHRVVVGGSYTPCTKAAWLANPWGDCRARPASWTSTDGRHWRASPPWTGRIGRPGRAGSDLAAIWRIPGDGWDAAQLFSGSDDSDDNDPTGPYLWHAERGRTWALLEDEPPDPRPACRGFTPEDLAGFAGDGGIRVIAYACGNGDALMTSANGRQYRLVTGFPRLHGQWIAAGLRSRGTRPWLFAGGHELENEDLQAMVWASGDLETWTSTVLPLPDGVPGAFVRSLRRWGAGYVATGPAFDGVNAWTLTWLSDDGVAWRLAATQPRPGVSVWETANGPAGTLGFDHEKVAHRGWPTFVFRLDSAP